jgi:hypothetical protein
VDLGKAREEIAGGGLGFLELASTNELGRGVGGGDQVILVIGSSEPRKELGFCRTLLQATGRERFQAQEGGFPCTQPCSLTPGSTSCCSPSISISSIAHVTQVREEQPNRNCQSP